MRVRLVLEMREEEAVEFPFAAIAKWFGLLKQVGELGTQGPADDEQLVHTGASNWAGHTAAFSSGWYDGVKVVQANAGRVGVPIVPEAVVVHTTDMLPDAFNALLKAWSTSAGSGAAAHFILGRTPEQGLVQMIPITRNGNHAGGPTKSGKVLHGWFVTKTGALIHPNLLSVGIEVHNAGALQWKPGSDYRIAQYVDNKRVLAEFVDGDTFVDNFGRPWHAATKYQLETLEQLLIDLHPVLKVSSVEPRADAAFIQDRSRWDTSYAVPTANTLVGHVSLDPINKTDPGPQLMTFINALAQKEHWT